VCGRRSIGVAQRSNTPRHPAAYPKFAKVATVRSMSTMNISLPEDLEAFVDEQVSERGYGTSHE
jgi:hypothetical protein